MKAKIRKKAEKAAVLFSALLITGMSAGCAGMRQPTDDVSPEAVYAEDKNADFFVYEDTVYVNAQILRSCVSVLLIMQVLVYRFRSPIQKKGSYHTHGRYSPPLSDICAPNTIPRNLHSGLQVSSEEHSRAEEWLQLTDGF